MQNGTLIMIHGFEETGTKKLLEIDTCLHEMRHVKSGASLVWLEREDAVSYTHLDVYKRQQEGRGNFRT